MAHKLSPEVFNLIWGLIESFSDRISVQMCNKHLYRTLDAGRPARHLQLVEANAMMLCDDAIRYSKHFSRSNYAAIHTIEIAFGYMSWSQDSWNRYCNAISKIGPEEINVKDFDIRDGPSWRRVVGEMLPEAHQCRILRLKDCKYSGWQNIIDSELGQSLLNGFSENISNRLQLRELSIDCPYPLFPPDSEFKAERNWILNWTKRESSIDTVYLNHGYSEDIHDAHVLRTDTWAGSTSFWKRLGGTWELLYKWEEAFEVGTGADSLHD